MSTTHMQKIAVFDLYVTKASPAGSCVLQMIEGLCKEFSFTVFSDAFDNPAPDLIEWVRVPLPPKPVLLRYVTFQWLAPIIYQFYLTSHESPSLIMSTQGQYTNCDISYAHFCHKGYLKNQWPLVKKTGIRSLIRLANHRFNEQTESWAFKCASTVVVPSQGLNNELRQTYSQLPPTTKTLVIPNPVEVSSFRKPISFERESFLEGIGFDTQDLILSFAALGDFARKGLDYILTALNQLDDALIKLIVIGGTPGEIKTYQEKAKQLKVNSRVSFVGFQKDIRPYLWASDIFTFLSAYETFSLVAFQAAAAGLPIIASDVNGVNEVLCDGVNGWVVERSTSSLVEALKHAAANRASLPEMGKAASSAISKYTTKSFIENWRSVLLESLQKE